MTAGHRVEDGQTPTAQDWKLLNQNQPPAAALTAPPVCLSLGS